MKESTPRREFLKRSAAAGLAAAMPISKSMTDPGGLRAKRIVGHGGFTYEADPKWGNLDVRKHSVQHCHEMVLDSRGRLLCSAVAAEYNMLVYNKDGKLLDSWNHELPEAHGLSKAGEKADQTLWLTDSVAGRVINLDLDGRVIRELDPPPGELLGGKAFKPTETTVTEDGDIYVADGYGSNFVFHYDAKGRLSGSFGGPDHFDTAHGIAVDHRTTQPTLLITSRSANNFQRWSIDGKHLETYRLPGLSICRPVIDGSNTYFAVIVTASWWHYDGMVAVLDKDMKVVSLPGGSAPPADQSDFSGVEYDDLTFMSPHDVCLDDDKNIYVPQWYSGRTYPVRLKRI